MSVSLSRSHKFALLLIYTPAVVVHTLAVQYDHTLNKNFEVTLMYTAGIGHSETIERCKKDQTFKPPTCNFHQGTCKARL